MRLSQVLRYIVLFAAGLFSGLLLAQCFIVLASRQGGSFGGEVFPLLAIPLLFLAGCSIGSSVHKWMDELRRGG